MAYFKIVDIKSSPPDGVHEVPPIKVTVNVYDIDRKEIRQATISLGSQKDEFAAYQWVVKAFTTGLRQWCIVGEYTDGLGFTQLFDGE